MKKFLVVFISLVFCFIAVRGQYYNPYQQAYQYGQELARQQQQANQNAYNYGYAMGLVQSGQRLIAEGKYKEGFDKFMDAWNDYSYYSALECLGCCSELGIGVERDLEMADIYYEEGANHNEPNCLAAVRRINSNGHYPKSYRNNIIAALQAKFGIGSTNSNYSGGYYSPSTPSNNNNSSSLYTTCRICGGSGVCTSCHGTGGEWRDTGYYIGSGQKSWIECPSCRGNKRCFNCHGKGKQ